VGIQLSASKHTLVEGRLRKRLRQLGFNGFKAYLEHVLDNPKGKHERLHLIDAITTNKTDFFREPEHFRYLVEKALPEIEKKRRLVPGGIYLWVIRSHSTDWRMALNR